MATPPTDISREVLRWLKSKLPDEDWGDMQVVHLPQPPNAGKLTVAIARAYPRWELLGCVGFSELPADLAPGSPEASPRASSPQSAQDHAEFARLRRSFTQEYVGLEAIRGQLEDYVFLCWEAFVKRRQLPYISILQSSGFGKSRLVYELAAHNTAAPAAAPAAAAGAITTPEARLKVLYVCGRKTGVTGVPLVTPCLRGWLFPDKVGFATDTGLTKDLADRLFQIFTYALDKWDQVGADWLTLFLDEKADRVEGGKLKAYRTPSQPSRGHFTSIKNARIVVLAIDEARYLLQREADDTLGWFRRFRRALGQVNTRIRADYGSHAGIFAILADTNSQIPDFVPPSSSYHSGQDGTRGEGALLPPFILTHTIDIQYEKLLKNAQDNEHKTRVEFMKSNLLLSEKEARSVLASMGRPLWMSSDLADNAKWAELLTQAARKVLRGSCEDDLASFNGASLNGIGSVLCRVGIRPYAWSPLASRAVADAMAILVHMNHTNDQIVTTYSSEPVLTFGAARVWHAAQGAFELKVLPQLRKLLHQEVMDTGGNGELVARILLLLAMDATGVIQSGDESKRFYAGEFYSVADFLRALHGESPTVEDPSRAELDARPDVFLAQWEGCSFTRSPQRSACGRCWSVEQHVRCCATSRAWIWSSRCSRRRPHREWIPKFP